MIVGFLELFFPEAARWAEDEGVGGEDFHLIELQIVPWYLEACVTFYNFLRLSSIKSTQGRLEMKRHVVTSYQRALSVSDVVLEDRVLSESLIFGTLRCGWQTPRTAQLADMTRDFIDDYCDAANRRPSDPANKSLPTDRIIATVVAIIDECSSILSAEYGFPIAATEVDWDVLEVLFGEFD